MNQIVLLVRHAQTDYAPDRLAGHTPGVGLSEKGRAQAVDLAARLRPVRLAALYTSPLDRCRLTAAAVAEGRKTEPVADDRLSEVRFGSWDGKRYATLRKTPLWRTVQLLPSQARFPKGESVAEMQARAVGAVEDLRARHRRGVVAVFSHADVIKAVTAHYLGMHLDLFQRLDVAPASVTAVAFGDVFPRVLRVGDTGDYTFLAPRPRASKPKGARSR